MISNTSKLFTIRHLWRRFISEAMKQVIRRVVNCICSSRRLQLSKWKTTFALQRLRGGLAFADHIDDATVTCLRNSLPNCGGFPLDPATTTVESILANRQDVSNRQTDVAGFEGLALDDALVFTDEYKDFSFLPLAQAIVRIALDRFCRRDVSILELGCGSGHLLRFCRLLGVRRYLGIDANPVAFHYSPYITASPGHFRLLDLQVPIDFGVTFDIVCSFEVLEHIREDRLGAIFSTIRRHLSLQSVFLGTASLQQGVDVHIAVHEKEWWLQRFRQHGLLPCTKQQEYGEWLTRNHPFNWNDSNSSVFTLEPTGGSEYECQCAGKRMM